MQDTIVQRWNGVVKDSDIVYVLGDTCFSASSFIDMVERLNGNIHIIRGNHDDNAISKVKKNYTIKNIIYHRDILEVKDSGHNVILSHYPIHEWHKWFRDAIHLYGHVHGNKIGIKSKKSRSFRPRAYDVGSDLWDFTPVTLEQILESEKDLSCTDCMHYDVCAYVDQYNRQNCIYLK